MTDRKATIFVFSPFRMDPARRLLTRDGQPIELKPKEFDTLLVLVEDDGRVVDKDDLMARVWPDCYVSDGSLAKNISILRRALGEDVIETHRGRGYRIAAPVVRVEASGPSDAQSADSDSAASRSVVETRRRTGKAKWATVPIAILFVAFVAFRFMGTKWPKTVVPASAMPVRSILIQKEGAIDPLDEGFKLHAHEDPQYPLVLYNRETNGWDRWRIATKDQYYYYRSLSAEEKDFALQRDWKLACLCALESGGGFAAIDFVNEGPRFDIEFMQEGNKYFVGLTKQISPRLEFDDKIEFPGVGDVAHPHAYELRYDHLSRTASLWIDGKQVASGYRGHRQFQEDRGLFFGAEVYGSAPTGVGVFRRVRFEAE
jgi:DNA-binding winged helix-turn-helix (wHTH) protein